MWYPFKNYRKKPISYFSIIMYLLGILAVVVYIITFFLEESKMPLSEFMHSQMIENIFYILLVIFFLAIEYIYRRKLKK